MSDLPCWELEEHIATQQFFTSYPSEEGGKVVNSCKQLWQKLLGSVGHGPPTFWPLCATGISGPPLLIPKAISKGHSHLYEGMHTSTSIQQLLPVKNTVLSITSLLQKLFLLRMHKD